MAVIFFQSVILLGMENSVYVLTIKNHNINISIFLLVRPTISILKYSDH